MFFCSCLSYHCVWSSNLLLCHFVLFVVLYLIVHSSFLSSQLSLRPLHLVFPWGNNDTNVGISLRMKSVSVIHQARYASRDFKCRSESCVVFEQLNTDPLAYFELKENSVFHLGFVCIFCSQIFKVGVWKRFCSTRLRQKLFDMLYHLICERNPFNFFTGKGIHLMSRYLLEG